MSITPEPNRSPRQGPDDGANVCPECQARNPRRAATCWLCYAPLRPDLPPDDREVLRGRREWDALDQAVHEARQLRTARMTGVVLSLVVLLAGGGLLAIGESESVLCGLLLFGVALPTLIFLFRPSASTEAREAALANFGVLSAINAIAIAFLVVVASIVMFVATCVPVGLATYDYRHGGSEMFAIVAGIVTAGGIAYLIAWAFFRKRRPPQSDRV